MICCEKLNIMDVTATRWFLGPHSPSRQPYLRGQDLVESVGSLDAPLEDGRGPAAEGLAAHPVAMAGQERLLQARDAHTLGRHFANTGTALGPHLHRCHRYATS